MGMYDFLTLANDKAEWTTLLTGSYSVSLGDTLSAFIGSGRQTHIVGDEIKYVLDWEGCLERIPYLHGFMESFPVSLLLGEGGNMTWTFGRKTDLHYLGPAITIKRAGTKEATSRGNFMTPTTKPKDFEGSKDEWKAKEAVSKSTGVIAGLMSAATILINTGIELVARIKYQDSYKKSDKEAVEKMATFCTASLVLTTRMMFLVKVVELCAATARTEASYLFESKKLFADVKLAFNTATTDVTVRSDAAFRLAKAYLELKKMLPMIAKVTVALVAMMAMLGVVVGLLVASSVVSE